MNNKSLSLGIIIGVALLGLLFLFFLISHIPFFVEHIPNRDIPVVKITDNGRVVWTKVIDFGGDDFYKSWYETPDGGYVIYGRATPKNRPFFREFVLKLSDKGQIEWNKSIGGPVCKTRDGKFASIGGGWFTKFDQDGTILINQSVPEMWSTYFNETEDGGFISYGMTTRYFERKEVRASDENISYIYLPWNESKRHDESFTMMENITITKLNGWGNISWQLYLPSRESRPSSISESDGEYRFVTYRYGADRIENNTLFYRLDQEGKIRNISPYNSTISISDDRTQQASGKCIKGVPTLTGIPTRDGGCFFMSKYCLKPTFDRTDTNGNTKWSRQIRDVLMDSHFTYSQTRDGGFFIIGEYDNSLHMSLVEIPERIF